MPKTELEYLESIEDLLGVLVRHSLGTAIKEHLADPKLRKLYDETGSKKITELAAETGFSTGKISGIWQRWEEAGLIVKKGTQYKKVL